MSTPGGRSSEYVLTVGGVNLCADTFGDRNHPAVLLPSSAMLFWEDALCRRMAAAQRFVVRYDIRDTGRSTACPAGAPDYSLRDLGADQVGVLNALDLPRAHLVGFSVTGWICQLTALDHPDRVSALTLINTRPTAPGPADTDLPEHADRIMTFLAEAAAPDWSDRTAVIDHCVEQARVLAGPRGADNLEARQHVTRIVDRTTDMAASSGNLAFAEAGERWRERLVGLAVRTLVIHGTDDPFFPYGNGEALAREIPDAELMPLDGIGHELPIVTWERVLAAVVAHTPEG